MKALVLAEKPSVGHELGRVLGCRPAGKGYLESNAYIVTWALGHLVSLAEPHDYDPAFKRWQLSDLPLLPERIKLIVIRESRHQFNIVKELLQRADVTEMIVATDAGREGELVARWIMQKAGWKRKPFRRLWISSQTETAIKDGFASLKPGQDYDRLYRAALCRAEADWLVGLNVTRALTCKFEARLNAGRVQTPTLALVVQRENEIMEFIPGDYWLLQADFGDYYGIWENSKGQTRIFSEHQANELQYKIRNSNGTGLVTCLEVKTKTEGHPLAYDLTSLQRDANTRYSLSAKQTLNCAQSLYEIHKVITYPRTDSRYITDDMIPTLRPRLAGINFVPYNHFVKPLLAGELVPGRRFVDNGKVSDHHAIIPTELTVNMTKLDPQEKRVYDLIIRRFLEVLSPPYIYDSLKLITAVCGENFVSRGIRVKQSGWRAVNPFTAETDNDEDEPQQDQVLHDLNKGSTVRIKDIKLLPRRTKPPARYTEASLLAAMESPGRFIDDEELRESIKSGGLGTPATRAEIIEKLLRVNYLERDGKVLIPTPMAYELIRLVPEELRSPELTAQWELRLSNIAAGKEEGADFMERIRDNTVRLVDSIKKSQESYQIRGLSSKECPECGEKMIKLTTKYVCSSRHCGYVLGEERKTRGRKGRSSRQEKLLERQLIRKFGQDGKQEKEETLGDLFDF